MKEINTVSDFYQFIENTKGVTDNFERTKLMSKQLSVLSEQSIINFEKFMRKELIRVSHYNIVLLFELNYPSPLLTKGGKPFQMPGDPYISTDGFIYFRCGIILLGEKAVKQLLEDPNHIMTIRKPSVAIDAESLLYCAADALKIKGLATDLSTHLDKAEHYDQGNYTIAGEKIKWWEPEENYPELVRYYNYHRVTMELPDH
jgi:hypothetical protein